MSSVSTLARVACLIRLAADPARAMLMGLCLALWALCGAPALAQSPVTALVGGSASDSAASESTVVDPAAALLDAIRAAAESGATVVVVDGQGQVLSGSEQVPSEAAASNSSVMMQLQSEADLFGAKLRERLQSLPNSINEVLYVLRATSPTGEISTYVGILFIDLLLLMLARWITQEIYAKRFLRRYLIGRIKDAPEGFREKMPFLVFRFVMGITVTIVSVIVAYVLGLLLLGQIDDTSIRFTVTAIITAFFFTRTVADFWRMLLSPFLAQYRIPHFSDRDAKRLYTWAWVLAMYGIWSVVFATWIKDFGLNYNVYAILYGVLELGGALANIAMVIFNARPISNAILHGQKPEQSSWILRLVSNVWAPALIVYFVIGWLDLLFDLVLERELGMPMIAGAYIAFMSVVLVYGAINYAIEIFFERARRMRQIKADAEAAARSDAAPVSYEISEAPRPGTTPEDTADRRASPQVSSDEMSAMEGDLDGDGDEEGGGGPRQLDDVQLAPIPHHTVMTYEHLARRVAGIIAFCVGLYAMVEIWNPALLANETGFVATSLDVLVILFIGYIVYHAFRIWIDSKIAEELEDMPEPELGDEGGGAASASRLATLLPLFRGAILAVVVISIALIALMELGVNVSPLFAGAGVVGLAVGFGAQTLVRDIFSGAFFLIDDAFRKGEYIDIGEVKGTVEKISVRSMQLRHHLGALNTIPFGEIKVLTNYSRDWVMMKLPLRVTYDTDVERVRKLVKTLGKEMLKDPEIGENFIQPLKSQGVIEMQDSAMIIRVKFMTKPGDQWTIRKKVYQEIRELFAREGIKFAHREVTVRLADGKTPDELTEEEKKAVTGAVQTAIEDGGLPGQGGMAADER